MKNKWSEFRLRVNINAPVSKAYEAWTTIDGLTSWFLSKAIFTGSSGSGHKHNETIAGGDTYEWHWHGHPDSVAERGKVLTVNNSDKFSFTFSMGCTVSVSIFKEINETIVELIESNLPTDEDTMMRHYVGDMKGWTFYLANLKCVLEGGPDLRNRKVELKDVITA